MVKRVTTIIKDIPDAMYLLRSLVYCKIRKQIKLDNETILESICRGMFLYITLTNSTGIDESINNISVNYMLLTDIGADDPQEESASLGKLLDVVSFVEVLNEPI